MVAKKREGALKPHSDAQNINAPGTTCLGVSCGVRLAQEVQTP